MNKWLEILLGLILIIIPIILGFTWQEQIGEVAIEFLIGGLFWFVILIGLLFLLLGISDLREK